MTRSHGPGDLLELEDHAADGDETSRRLRRGTLLHLDGDVDEAARLYRLVLADDPGHAVAHNNLGFLLAQTGEMDEAIPHYEAALEANPRSSMALTNLGNARISRGDPGGVELLESAVEAAPENAIAWDSLGRARLLFEDAEGAEEALRTSARLAPDNVSTLVTLAAVIAVRGRLAEAIDILEAAVQEDPGAPEAWHQLGMVRFARRDLGAAREAFATAGRLDPRRIDSRRQLALTLTALGETERAMVELRQMLDVVDRADVSVDLAVLELASGDARRARNRLMEATQHARDDRTRFHLALAHLACDETADAAAILSELADSASDYAAKAGEYLDAMRSRDS